MTEDHDETIAELRGLIRDFAAEHDLTAADRAGFESEPGTLPSCWQPLQDLGVLGLHVPEHLDGGGADWAHLVAVLEELGAAVAPGPILPTVAAAEIITRAGAPETAAVHVPGLATGAATAAIIVDGSALSLQGTQLTGSATAIGIPMAETILAIVGADLVIISGGEQVAETAEALRTGDPGTDLFTADLDVTADAVIPGAGELCRAFVRLAAGALAVGGARVAFTSAAEYAKTREQFGSAIGSFQAVKHHMANMLIEREAGEALVWDAVRQADRPDSGDLVRAAAAITLVTLPAFVFNARTAIQIFGGIGFSWEHDIHLHYRRALTLAGLLPAGAAAEDLTSQWTPDLRDERHPSLPDQVEAQREQLRSVLADIARRDPADHLRGLVDAGLAMPQFDRPWGIEAAPAMQMLIGQEMDRAGIEAPNYGITGWCAGAIIQKGSDQQVERYADAALMGEEIWCQLFSEPDAGSDAAAVKTKGVRVDGGWLVTGQKVWTSYAHRSSFGLATVRTDMQAGKHAGLTAMIIDMHAPGVDIRPLRQITDRSDFNEVWLEDVFVPDENVVGEPGEGWAIARSTFENERMSLGRGSTDGRDDEEELLAFFGDAPRPDAHLERVGRFLARRHAARMINLRGQERAVTREEAGAAGNITKMLRSELLEEIGRIELSILGSRAAAAAPGEADFAPFHRLLDSPRASIAGGTEEIVRTQIAERIIGLPRERAKNM